MKNISNLKRNSRIMDSKNFILNNSLSGCLNNTKWKELFDVIEMNNLSFELKTLLSNNIIKCEFIREVENSALLIDDSGNFIEYLEIDNIMINRNKNIKEFLIDKRIEYLEDEKRITVFGYKK